MIVLVPYQFLILYWIVHSINSCYGFYISYEHSNSYKKGDSVPITVNKLTSPITLSSIDYAIVPLCGHNNNNNKNTNTNQPEQFHKLHPQSKWQHAMQSLHGDMYYSISDTLIKEPLFELRMLEDLYCQHACYIDMNVDTNEDDTNDSIQRHSVKYIIQNSFRYNWYIDHLPAIFQIEDDNTVSLRYWGGVPIGLRGQDIVARKNLYAEYDNYQGTVQRYGNVSVLDLIYYNHYNFRISYKKHTTNDDETTYKIVKVIIEPYSIQHLYQNRNSSTSQNSNKNNIITTPIESCSLASSSTSNKAHTNYAMLRSIPPLKVDAVKERVNQFTYDVIWIEETSNVSYKSRWNKLLSMDSGIPTISLVMGVVLGVVILAILGGSLYVWLLRDLSYKPVIALFETEDADGSAFGDDLALLKDGDIHDRPLREEENSVVCNNKPMIQYDEEEVQMWPLSTRIFFPPLVSPLLLCIIAGTGAQNLIPGLLFVILFRFGIVSQTTTSNGSNNILTGAVIVYTLFGPPVGGYVTGRLYKVFHGDRLIAIAGSLVTAIAYPLLGMLVVWVVYDALPIVHDPGAPHFHAMANSTPIVYIWIFYMWPITALFGWLGHRAGPIQYFPVSKGALGYQDLDLQDYKTMDNDRIEQQQQQQGEKYEIQQEQDDSTSPLESTSVENTTAAAESSQSPDEPSQSQTKSSQGTAQSVPFNQVNRLFRGGEEKKDDDYKTDDEDIVRNVFSDSDADDDNKYRIGGDIDEDDDDDNIQRQFQRYGMAEDDEMPRNYYMSDDYAASNAGLTDDYDDANDKKHVSITRPEVVEEDVVALPKPAGITPRRGPYCCDVQWKQVRIPALFLSAGILPVLSAFISYSYNVAAPLFLGYYSGREWIIAAFMLFIADSAAVTILLYYHQIRVAGSHNQSYCYQWWWAAVASGGSSGFYLFLLSISWLVRYRTGGPNDDEDQSTLPWGVSPSTWIAYVIWFAYISFGTALMTGFCGIAGCIIFNRSLYMYILRQKEVA